MSSKYNILLLNGPNLNMLGVREPGHYGHLSLAEIERHLQQQAVKQQVALDCFQANSEEKLIEKIHQSFQKVDFIIINPAAYTHTSIAILDALKAVSIPFVEVHISDVASREGFRQVSYIRPYAALTVSGEGIGGYRQAILYLTRLLAHTASIPL